MAAMIVFQSTHPRGVRHGDRACLGRSLDFNPRTHVGCDGSKSGSSIPSEIFQSTHPRGVRLPPRLPAGRTEYFNPRTHVGCDPAFIVKLYSHQAFQSTHPRGVRPTANEEASTAQQFQSTHPRGVRPGRWRRNTGWSYISIHAPTWGAT